MCEERKEAQYYFILGCFFYGGVTKEGFQPRFKSGLSASIEECRSEAHKKSGEDEEYRAVRFFRVTATGALEEEKLIGEYSVLDFTVKYGLDGNSKM